MKKILIATDAYLPRWDGIARFLFEIIPRIKKDYEITVIAPTFPGYEKYADSSDIKVIRIPTHKFKVGDYYLAKFKRKIIDAEVKKADLVWTHAIAPIGSLAILSAKKHKKPVVSFIHSLEWELAMNSLDRRNPFRMLSYFIVTFIAIFFYNKCDVLMVPSKETDEIMTWKGISSKKEIVYLGVDTEKFKPADNKKEAKKNIGINPEKKVIGFAGRLGREKDLPTVYRAFKKILEDNSDVLFLVVGRGVQEQEKMIMNDPNVKWVGSSDNIIPFLQAMDVYVLASLTETTSLATMEAMACGLPVVTTQVGYVKRYVKNKQNGMFFPKRNYMKLSLILKYLLKREDIMRDYGKAARKTIVDDYNWTRTADSVKEILDNLLE